MYRGSSAAPMAMVALSKKSTVSAGAQVGSCIDRRERFGFRFSGAATLASSRPLGTAPVPAGLVGKVKRGDVMEEGRFITLLNK